MDLKIEMAQNDDQELTADASRVIAKQIREFRTERNESQLRFWSRFGVTQSRGSRFELGKSIPRPVAILLTLYFNKTISDQHLRA